jgi:ParB family transcriptional regulator, chromosome partitioning protein
LRLQPAAVEQAEGHRRAVGGVGPYLVKRLVTQSAVPLDSDLGQFVGAVAYAAAGGRIHARFLFSCDEDGFLDDAALVRRLALAKLEVKAAELRHD